MEKIEENEFHTTWRWTKADTDAYVHIPLYESVKAKVTVTGVALYSRDNLPHEYEVMTDIVGSLAPFEQTLIKSVSCDSHAGCMYEVELTYCSAQAAKQVGQVLTQAFCERHGGFNGLVIKRPGPPIEIEIGAHWPPDEDVSS